MSEAKFTKGEWRCCDGTQFGEQVLFVDVKNKGDVVCRLTKLVNKHIPLSEEDIANTHLIAAAPDMYKMLNNIAISMECEHGVDCDAINTLLAKARGE